MRPTELSLFVNHTTPSGPTVIELGATMPGPPTAVTTPAGVMWPIEFPPLLVNHTPPSAAGAIPYGSWIVGSWNNVVTPAGVTLPMLPPFVFVNQMFPSGPNVMPRGVLMPVDGNVVTSPPGVTRPTLPPPSVPPASPAYHTLPSDPVVSTCGADGASPKRVIAPAVVT